MTELATLTRTPDVIAALGGVVAVCDLTGYRYNRVHNWLSAPTFPARVMVVMLHALQRKGYTAPPSLWGMDAVPADAQVAIEVPA